MLSASSTVSVRWTSNVSDMRAWVGSGFLLVGRRGDEHLQADLLQDVLVDPLPLLRGGQRGLSHHAAAAGGDALEPSAYELYALLGVHPVIAGIFQPHRVGPQVQQQ